MTYSEFKETITELHTGASTGGQIDNITKLVLGKLARLKLKARIKIGEKTTNLSTEFSFNILTEFDDFFALKPDAENNNRCVYYFESTTPVYLRQTNPSRYEQAIEGGVATLIGRTMKIRLPSGASAPSTLFVPYFSKFLVLDEDGTTEKEKPEEEDDTFLFDSVFDDSLVDGVLLYLKRKELSDGEFAKASKEWRDSLNDILFYN